MKTKKVLIIFTAVMFMCIVFSGEVLAEGEIPPEPPAEEVEAQPTAGEDTAEMVLPESLPMSEPENEGGEADLGAEGQLTGSGADESVDLAATETAVTADLVEVEILDAAGEPMDMARKSSAEVALAGDPWFKVGTTTYRFFKDIDGCDAYPGEIGITCFDDIGAGVIQGVLDFIRDEEMLPTDKKVYVEAGTYEGFALDNSNIFWPQLAGVIGAGSGQTILTSSVFIEDNLNGFTFSGFSIKAPGQLFVDDCSGLLKIQDVAIEGSTGSGILVSDHTGNVEISEVNVENSAEGLAVMTNGNVKVSNSSFHGNDDFGIKIHGTSTKAVTMDGVVANTNIGNGIEIERFSSLTIKNSVMRANGNLTTPAGKGWGLYAVSALAANVSLDHIYATDNFSGILIISHGNLSAKYIEALNNVSLEPTDIQAGLQFDGTGTARVEFSKFNNNGGIGLSIWTERAITINSVRAEGNGDYGAHLFNGTGSGGVTVTSPTAGGSLQANGFFDNTNGGMRIDSNGAVIINNVDFGENHGEGLCIDTQASVTIGVTIPNWINSAYLNQGRGIDIHSNGNITISQTSADANTHNGFWIRNYGIVKLNKISASNNGESGAYIGNEIAASAKNVQLTDCLFDLNGHDGIWIDTKGSVSASGLAASDNHSSGVRIYANYGSGGVSIQPSKNIYDTYFNNNGNPVEIAHGLHIVANGPISLNGIAASGNVKSGVYLDSGTSNAAVTIQNTRTDGFNSDFNDNGLKGLHVATYGTITLKNVNAIGNGEEGAHLDNCFYDAGLNGCQGSGSITVNASAGKGNQFNGNGSYGLFAQSRGMIKLVNTDACDNGWTGAFLQNNFSNSAANVMVSTISSWRNFYDNNNQGDHEDQAGLWLVTHGTISISKAQANGNLHGAYGIYLNNRYSAGPKTIAATDLYTNGNDNDGLYAAGSGIITVTGIESEDNIGDGAFLTNYNAAANITVTSNSARKSNSFERNANGLAIADTAGAVFLQDIRANKNGMDGVFVDNTAGEGAVTVKAVNAISRFNENGWYGLEIISSGTVTLTGSKNWIEANNNSQDIIATDFDGITIDTTSAGPTKTVTISTVRANGNDASGIFVKSNGVVNLTSIYTTANNKGIEIDNTSGSGSVRIQGSNTVSLNTEFGVEIQTHGAITLSGLTVEDNGFSGIYAESLSSGLVTVSNTILHDNGSHGIYLASGGNYLLTNIVSVHNGNAYNADGMAINAGTSSIVTIKNSVFMDNRGNGIQIVHPDTEFTPLIYTSSWFGNDWDGSGNLNLWVATVVDP